MTGKYRLQLGSECGLGPREFLGGSDFEIAHRVIPRILLRPLNSRILDLLRIAASVYFLDRLIRRDRKHGPESWARTISYSLEVREPEFWMSPPVHRLLQETLSFLSGDRWGLTFSRFTDDERNALEWQRPLDSEYLGGLRRVCLYSGGLDSAAGLARQIVGFPNVATLAVTVQHRTDLGRKAGDQLRVLSQSLKADCIPVVVPFEMPAPKTLVRSEEKSQRSRAFLFAATGAAVAAALGLQQLEMYESGLGAINVPLLVGMEGSQATRGSHPTFLRLMSELLTHVVGHDFHVVLPFAGMTKGELVGGLASEELRKLAASTVSCAHFPVRVEQGDHWRSCGLCPACIFRRVALHAAGIEEASDRYQHDLFDPRCSQLPAKKLRYLTAYLLQIDSLRDLDDSRLPPLIARHLAWTDVIHPGESPHSYVEMFRRYRSEWYGFLEQVRRQGGAFASRIDLPGQAA